MSVKVNSGNENKPWVSNYAPLKAWLDKVKARCLWQTAQGGRDPHTYIEGWQVNGRVVVLIVRANKMGWEIYTGADSIQIDETLADVERRVGLGLDDPWASRHKALDAVAAAWLIAHPGRSLSSATILDLIEWSGTQLALPTLGDAK